MIIVIVIISSLFGYLLYELRDWLLHGLVIRPTKTRLAKFQEYLNGLPPNKPVMPRLELTKPNNPVREVRVGSHKVWHEAIQSYKGSRGWHENVTDYKTVFDDCLPGKKWLEEHYEDTIPEPSIELLADGKSIASINGNFKRGTIKEALKPYTTKARVGRKTVTFDFGEADRVIAQS